MGFEINGCTVRVLAGGRPQGAGFCQGEKLFTTCAHVAGRANERGGYSPLPDLAVQSLQTRQTVPVTPVESSWHSAEDVAFLCSTSVLDGSKVLNLQSTPLRIGEECHLVGVPELDLDWLEDQPAVVGFPSRNGVSRVQLKMKIHARNPHGVFCGFSGAPLLGRDGVAGMFVEFLQDAENVALALPAQVLDDLNPQLPSVQTSRIVADAAEAWVALCDDLNARQLGASLNVVMAEFDSIESWGQHMVQVMRAFEDEQFAEEMSRIYSNVLDQKKGLSSLQRLCRSMVQLKYNGCRRIILPDGECDFIRIPGRDPVMVEPAYSTLRNVLAEWHDDGGHGETAILTESIDPETEKNRFLGPDELRHNLAVRSGVARPYRRSPQKIKRHLDTRHRNGHKPFYLLLDNETATRSSKEIAVEIQKEYRRIDLVLIEDPDDSTFQAEQTFGKLLRQIFQLPREYE